jgi:exodeoxyribonuclease-3
VQAAFNPSGHYAEPTQAGPLVAELERGPAQSTLVHFERAAAPNGKFLHQVPPSPDGGVSPPVEAGEGTTADREPFDPEHDASDTEAGVSDSVRLYSWNVWARFGETNQRLVAGWPADIVLLNDQRSEDDHRAWVERNPPRADWHIDQFSTVSFGPRLEMLAPLDHADFRAPIMHLLWKHGDVELHLFSVHAFTPVGTQEQHLKFLREPDTVLHTIEELTGHRRTIIAGDFNSLSPLDGEDRYVYSVARFMNSGYLDTYAELNPEQFEATKIAGNNTGKRIDYFFVSEDLRSTLVAAGVDTTPTYPEHSDHRPVWLELDLSQLSHQG